MKGLENYVTVNQRIMEFYEKFPNGRIITEVISVNEGVVLMKASIFKNAESRLPDATGHAYEKEGSSFVNKTSYIENCETSAVGRALGIMGISISKSIASKEEVENAIVNQELLKEEKDKPISSSIKAKYQLLQGDMSGFENWVEDKKGKVEEKYKSLKGDMDGFEKWIENMREKGNTNQQIDIFLTKKIMEREKK